MSRSEAQARDTMRGQLERTQAELEQAQARVKSLEEALPPAHRLRTLAQLVDSFYPNDPEPEIQADLRAWADAIEAVLAEGDSDD